MSMLPIFSSRRLDHGRLRAPADRGAAAGSAEASASSSTAEASAPSAPSPAAPRGPAGPGSMKRARTQRRVDEELVEMGPVEGGTERLPLGIQPRVPDLDTAGWLQAQRPRLRDLLAQHGALLFRGFDVRAPAAFHAFAGGLTSDLLDYSERAAPRREVAQQVYTSTEYPPEYPIPMHHENAFAYRWPMVLFFYCHVPAAQGGETPIADDVALFARLDPAVREEFRRRQVMYVRNYGAGLDMSWQEAFQARSREEVEQYCQAANLTCEWLDRDRLRTRRVAPAIVPHPRTGHDLWFNHAHLFHVSNLEDTLRESFLREFAEEDLPRNAYFGDGARIDDALLAHVRETYAAVAIRFPWRQGDILMLDNMTIAHGREPFSGPRSTLVMMAESSHEHPPRPDAPPSTR